MSLRAMRRIAEIATDIGGTDVDFGILEERYLLAERECALERKLKCIEKDVYAKYPDARMARLVVGDILRIDKCTTLRRRSTLLRMKEHALQLLDMVDREVVAEQFEMKLEMYEIKKSLIVNEAKIREHVRKRRSTDNEEKSPKLARKK